MPSAALDSKKVMGKSRHCWCLRVSDGFCEIRLCCYRCLFAFPAEAQLCSDSWDIRGEQANHGPWQSLFVQPVFDVFHCLPLWESGAARAIEMLPGNQLCLDHYIVLQVKDQIMEPCRHLLLVIIFLSFHKLCWPITAGQTKDRQQSGTRAIYLKKEINVLGGGCVTDRHTNMTQSSSHWTLSRAAAQTDQQISHPGRNV